MPEDLTKLARDFQLRLFLGRHGVTRKKLKERRKKVTCNSCFRQMETIESENPPYYCWRCGDKLELGGYHEL